MSLKERIFDIICNGLGKIEKKLERKIKITINLLEL